MTKRLLGRSTRWSREPLSTLRYDGCLNTTSQTNTRAQQNETSRPERPQGHSIGSFILQPDISFRRLVSPADPPPSPTSRVAAARSHPPPRARDRPRLSCEIAHDSRARSPTILAGAGRPPCPAGRIASGDLQRQAVWMLRACRAASCSSARGTNWPDATRLRHQPASLAASCIISRPAVRRVGPNI